MQPLVGIIMGSSSDMDTLQAAVRILEEFDVPHEIKVVSAHRTPDAMFEYARAARGRELKVIIACAGGAAHLPGMVASLTTLPVIGVPAPTTHLGGEDSLLSIVQMPAGIPVATVAIGNSANAALLAIRILALENADLALKLEAYAVRLRELVAEMNQSIERTFPA